MPSNASIELLGRVRELAMAENNYASQTVSSEQLKAYSEHFANCFLNRSICCQPLLSDIADFSFYATEVAYQAESKRRIAGPIYSEKEENGCRIHLCMECLQGIPSLALQGWLEQELTFCRQFNREVFYCNFRLMILPLFNVVGSAENFIRELVHYIEFGLRRYLATKKLVDLELGMHQVYLHFYRLDPAKLPEDRYQATIPFPWTRAHFLSKKLLEYIPIALLSYRNIGFAGDLDAAWWQYHAYFLPEDKDLLKALANIPTQHHDASYCDNVVRMFEKIKHALLIPKAPAQESHALH
jgi:hypothetical protein